MAKFGTNSWQAREALADRAPFETHGALRAMDEQIIYAGHLPEPWRTQFFEQRDRMVYAVYSYSTPIAWVLDDKRSGEVIVPRELTGRNEGSPVKYSITTTRHQSMLYALMTDTPETRANIWEAAARERQTDRDRAAARREERAEQAWTGAPSHRLPSTETERRAHVEFDRRLPAGQYPPSQLVGAQSGADVDFVRARFPRERPVW